MDTRLPLLHPSMDTDPEPAKKLDFVAEEATAEAKTRLTWAEEAAAVAIADAMVHDRSIGWELARTKQGNGGCEESDETVLSSHSEWWRDAMDAMDG